MSIMELAAGGQHIDVAQLLLDRGADAHILRHFPEIQILLASPMGGSLDMRYLSITTESSKMDTTARVS